VAGEVVERNVGEKDHNKVQKKLLLFLASREKELGVFVVQEQRIRIAPDRYRIPDISVVWGPEPDEQVFTSPPFLCVEILSPEDRAGKMQEKIDDYLGFGVRYVWVINPQTRRAEIHTATGSVRALDGLLKTESPEIIVPLAELFEA
jgi:Uma2 family endonuclease